MLRMMSWVEQSSLGGPTEDSYPPSGVGVEIEDPEGTEDGSFGAPFDFSCRGGLY